MRSSKEIKIGLKTEAIWSFS